MTARSAGRWRDEPDEIGVNGRADATVAGRPPPFPPPDSTPDTSSGRFRLIRAHRRCDRAATPESERRACERRACERRACERRACERRACERRACERRACIGRSANTLSAAVPAFGVAASSASGRWRDETNGCVRTLTPNAVAEHRGGDRTASCCPSCSRLLQAQGLVRSPRKLGQFVFMFPPAARLGGPTRPRTCDPCPPPAAAPPPPPPRAPPPFARPPLARPPLARGVTDEGMSDVILSGGNSARRNVNEGGTAPGGRHSTPERFQPVAALARGRVPGPGRIPGIPLIPSSVSPSGCRPAQ